MSILCNEIENKIYYIYIYIVKPVYNSHHWDQPKVELVDRWS